MWGASEDEHFWKMESSVCLPLESSQCQCCLPSTWLWSCHLHPQRTTLCGRKWSDLNSPISLLGSGVLPMELSCDCPGWSWLFHGNTASVICSGKREGRATGGCSWSEMSPRVESEGKLASKCRYFMKCLYFLWNDSSNCSSIFKSGQKC